MEGITITHEHILLAAKIVPCLTLVYILFKCRGAIKLNAKLIKITLITSVTCAALAMTISNWLSEAPQERETRLQKERDALEDKLPGKWGNLYQAIENLNNSDVRVMAVMAFKNKYHPNDIEPLPIEGFQMFMNKTYKSRRKKAVTEMLNPYLIPFNDPYFTQHGPRMPTESLVLSKEN